MTKLITDIIIDILEKHKYLTAFIDNKTQKTVSYSDVKLLTLKTVAVIQKYLNAEQQNLIIYLKPKAMSHIIDFAVMLSNNVSVMCDFTYTASETVSAAEHLNSPIIFTDNFNFVKQIKSEIDRSITVFYVGDKKIDDCSTDKIKVYSLLKILNEVSDKDVVLPSVSPDSYATIFFSSGTMNKPKCVVYTHQKLTNAYLSHCRPYNYTEEGGCLSILSSSHLCPKLCDWLMLANGIYIVYSDYVNYIRDIRNFRPKYLICVPKLLAIHKADYFRKLSEKSKLFQLCHNILYSLSEKYYDIKNKSKFYIADFISLYFLKICNLIGIKIVFSKILKEIDFPVRSNIMAFGAFIEKPLEMFYSIVGEELLINYGLTEGATVTYSNHGNKKIGSVGKVSPDISLIITNPETGEILPNNNVGLIKIKGGQIMLGYYNDTEMTKEVFDENGYMSTGDMGLLTKDNFLFFKGRYKSVIILNNGENIYPESLEALCIQSDFVSQIIICGQDKPYLTAIVVLNKDYVNNWLRNNEDSELKKTIIIDINNHLGTSKFFRWTQQIKNIIISDEPFTQENGLLNKKLGLNRYLIYKKYSEEIEALYKDE